MPVATPNERAPQAAARGPGRIVKTYDYRDEHGGLLFQVVRMEPKTFRQRVPKSGGAGLGRSRMSGRCHIDCPN